LALENLGDIDRQTIAGAIATGTHGTGVNFGGLATQVRGLTMITADGSRLRCSDDEHPDIYAAARIGLGALGGDHRVDPAMRAGLPAPCSRGTVFASPRRVRFTECEYAVPREAIRPVVQALRTWIDDHDERICFPAQLRVAAADDIWLSTAYRRETGYIAVHQYFKIDYRRYFAAFESIVAEHQGRPHWGKLHTLEAEQLRQLYPASSTSFRYGTGWTLVGHSITPTCGACSADDRFLYQAFEAVIRWEPLCL
jgi:FAD/FMN-containing dehydrogenase